MGPITDEFRQATEAAFNPIDGYTASEIEDVVRGDIEEKLEDEYISDEISIIDVVLSGSRSRGKERPDSDIDIVVEYEGDWSEDSLWNLLNEDGIEICGISVDINPITAGKTGTLEEYLPGVEEYLA